MPSLTASTRSPECWWLRTPWLFTNTTSGTPTPNQFRSALARFCSAINHSRFIGETVIDLEDGLVNESRLLEWWLRDAREFTGGQGGAWECNYPLGRNQAGSDHHRPAPMTSMRIEPGPIKLAPDPTAECLTVLLFVDPNLTDLYDRD